MTKNTKEISVNIPDVATKQLQIQTLGDKRRVTLSSNWLMVFGFDGKRVIEESLGKNKGIRVRIASEEEIAAGKSKKVYERTYNGRSANPLNPVAKRKERLVQIASQTLINESLGDSTHVHITFKYGVLTFLPVTEQQFHELKELDPKEQISTLVGMTGGVDCHVLEKSGFRIDTVIEYRPEEKRDTTDYTEMTSISTLINSKPRVLINEDIYKLDQNRLADIVGNAPISVGHFSIQCDDFSTLKTLKDKKKSVVELSSTLDMFIPMLSVLDCLKIPVLVIENVPGFMSSPINDVLQLQLMRRGYNVHQQVFDAREHGGLTSRKRMYLVATMLESEFSFPEPKPYSRNVWEEVILPNLSLIMEKDVTENKVVKDSIKMERARVISASKPYAPTLTKAQGQDTKDAVVVEHEGRIYRLPVSVQEELNCIPETFNLDWAPVDKAAQIIGQSICCSLHEDIMTSVKNHIRKEQYSAGERSILNIKDLEAA